MPHSYISCHVHYIFSTRGRVKSITQDMRKRLWAYMAGIARKHNVRPLSVGGTDDHAHILLRLPSMTPIAKAIQLIKGGSSKWVSEKFPTHEDFQWQEGYGAFCVEGPNVRNTMQYIRDQEKHHRLKTFEQEFVEFLERYGIEYDERYVWG